jgi:hypothetical protein
MLVPNFSPNSWIMWDNIPQYTAQSNTYLRCHEEKQFFGSGFREIMW